MFETKKILILGAGLMQKPAILGAKHLGYKAVVVDANKNAVAVPLADEFYPVDLKDREALLELAGKLNKKGELKGVFTAGTDFSASVSYVAEKLGLPAHAFEAALNASDKARMRACFEKSGVPSPKFSEIDSSSFENVKKSLESGETELPKVVKPCDNMGGRGCRLVRNNDEFQKAVSTAIKNSRTGRAIFEDYMEGAEFSIDSVVYNGTLTITGFADRHIFYPPYFIEMGHSLPSRVDSKIKNELIATFALGIKALGLTCGVAKADIKYTKNGPMIGEIAARLSGGYMSGWTFPYSSGMNLTEEAMKIALGQEPDYLLSNRVSLPWQPHESVKGKEQPFELYEISSTLVSAERAWLSIPGKVSKIYGLDEVKQIYGVRDLLPRVKEGDKVDFPRNNVEKCGNIIAVGINSEQAYKSAEEAVSSITLRLEPKNPETEKFLKGECESDEKGFPPSAFTFCPNEVTSQSVGEGTKIPAGQKTIDYLPETLIPLADSLKDWNHCTLRKTLEKFDEICPDHAELDGKIFWSAILRGGIQGALYVADNINK
ncbi:ATP-grasp domain-containing protein [Treponema ruminis]|uniref:Biotin carboxylase n=1 Tax=Treponema ruminis TaxID=744515 RepID=A0A7W8G7U7_9SPIR|nr:ATP-grasp domain-containing protein [Treponema ruminis]MBB5225306.1 biotin carboxylase [Treponema ruminis]QSI01823.1 ATP-grasp domain-containing protein [Treponema ruminis]